MAKIRPCTLLCIGLAAFSTGSAGAVPSPGAALADTSRALAAWAEAHRGSHFAHDPRGRRLAGSLGGTNIAVSDPATWPGRAGLGPPLGGVSSAPVVDPNLWGANGNVLDIARSGNTLYIAGSFRSVGEMSGGLVPVDAQTGELIRPFPKVAGSVRAMIPDGAGGWYIGGEFTGVGGKPRSCLAQIRANGTVTDWNPSVTGSPGYIDPPVVIALALHDSRLFVGGAFREIGGRPHENFGCVDARTGGVLDRNLDITPEGYVAALLVHRNVVFVAGGFSSVAGQPRSSLAALNAPSGDVLPWRADVFGGAYALQARDDTLYVGGDYIGIAGVEQHMLAALNATTAELLPFNARVSGIQLDYLTDPLVAGLAIVGDTLYVAGDFTDIGGVQQPSLAALNATTGDALPWVPAPLGPSYDGFPPPLLETVAVAGPTLYIGGWFNTVGGLSHSGVAALGRETGSVLSWDPISGSVVQTLALRGGTVFLGGELSFVGDWQHRAGLAAIDLATGAVKPWNPNPNGGICSAIAVSGDRVFVSGDFTSIGGDPQPRQYLAALDTVNGEVLGWNPGANQAAHVFLLEGDTLYTGGYFTQVGGQPRNYLAAIDVSTAEVTAWNPDANSWVLTMARSGTTIFVGGIFDRVGGQWRPCLAAVDALTGTAQPWDPQFVSGVVDALLVSSNKVYVGGGFEQIGGQPRNSIAALDATTAEATPWYPQASGWGSPIRVRALALIDSTLYVGGSFGTMGGQPRICLAAVDTATALATAWDPGLDGLVWSLRTVGGDLYVGGGFARAGGLPAVGLAAFSTADEPLPVPPAFALAQSIPNPARSSAVIRFSLPEAAAVTLSVYDLQGRRVATLLDRVFHGAGRHDVPVPSERWRPGVYLYRLEAGSRSATRKMVVIG